MLHVLNNLGKCPKISSDLKKTSPELTLFLRRISESNVQKDDDFESSSAMSSTMNQLLLIETKRLVLTLLRCIKNCKSMKDLLERPLTNVMEEAFQNAMVMDLADPTASKDNVFKSNVDLKG